jgi:DNA-binding NarL/FixJ family response regulator
MGEAATAALMSSKPLGGPRPAAEPLLRPPFAPVTALARTGPRPASRSKTSEIKRPAPERRVRLSPQREREREVLGLVAEGLWNKAIAGRLFVTERTVEAHVKQIFLKLRLETSPESNRRVLAVLAYLRTAS